jgi:hypothetical protein
VAAVALVSDAAAHFDGTSVVGQSTTPRLATCKLHGPTDTSSGLGLVGAYTSMQIDVASCGGGKQRSSGSQGYVTTMTQAAVADDETDLSTLTRNSISGGDEH